MLTLAGIVLSAAFVQGFLGFGFGVLSIVLLANVAELGHATSVVNIAGLLISTSMIWSLWSDVMWGLVRSLLPWLMVGVVLGVYLLVSIDAALLKRVLGVGVIGLAIWNLGSWRPSGTPQAWQDGAFGVIGGIFTGLFNTGGIVLVTHVYRRPDPPDALKATMAALFLLVNSFRLIAAGFGGLLTPAVWRDAGLASVFVLAGTALGMAVGSRTSGEAFRTATWLAVIAIGASLLVRA